MAPTACRHTVSGTISLPSLGFFSPFPRGTCSLSVASQYLALPDGPGRFMQGFTCPALLGILQRFREFRLPDYHRLWCAFPYASTTLIPSHIESRYPIETYVPMVWAIPLSLAATKGVTVLFFFLPGTKMFQFPGLPRSTLWIQAGVTDIHSAGLPHSETHGF